MSLSNRSPSGTQYSKNWCDVPTLGEIHHEMVFATLQNWPEITGLSRH